MPLTIATITWAFLIGALSLTPSGGALSFLSSPFDKIAHFSAYLVLAALMIQKRSFLFALILSVGYGIVIELVQGYIPGRNRDLLDVLANTAGVLCGITLGRLILWRK